MPTLSTFKGRNRSRSLWWWPRCKGKLVGVGGIDQHEGRDNSTLAMGVGGASLEGGTNWRRRRSQWWGRCPWWWATDRGGWWHIRTWDHKMELGGWDQVAVACVVGRAGEAAARKRGSAIGKISYEWINYCLRERWQVGGPDGDGIQGYKNWPLVLGHTTRYQQDYQVVF